MRAPLLPFDMQGFCRAVDQARQDRGLDWNATMREINLPFQGTPSIPIHLSTVRGMAGMRSVTSAVALQVLRWLGRAPEDFLAGPSPWPPAATTLPEPGPGRILRCNTAALHAGLDIVRRERSLTWKQVAAEIPVFTPSMLTNLACGPLIGFPRVMYLTQWLGQPAVTFVRICSR
jgi:hypothetical protein